LQYNVLYVTGSSVVNEFDPSQYGGSNGCSGFGKVEWHANIFEPMLSILQNDARWGCCSRREGGAGGCAGSN